MQTIVRVFSGSFTNLNYFRVRACISGFGSDLVGPLTTLHREALVARDMGHELSETVEVITKIIIYIKTRPSTSRVFQKLCADTNAEHRSLLFYCSSWWHSLEKSFERVCELVDELKDFLLQENNDLAAYLSEYEFLLKLAYLCDVFFKLNKLNFLCKGRKKCAWHFR